MRIRLVLVVFVLSFVAACSHPQAPVTKPDLAVEEKAIRDMDARWLKAAQDRDPAAEAAMFAADGVAYREHVEPLVGPEAYQAWGAREYADNPKAALSWTTDAIHVAESGDLAIQTGQFQMTGMGLNGDREDRGRFLTVWKKVGGEWKVAYDMGSTTMPEELPQKK